jgi:hypothetical protein
LGGVTHSITASFTPDASSPYSGITSSSVQVVVQQAATTITISQSPNTSVYGTAVNFTITVTGSLAGTAQFKDNGNALGDAASVGAGTGTFSSASLTVSGSPHLITAVFTPTNTNYASSTSNTLSQTVTAAATTTTVVTLVSPVQTTSTPKASDNLTLRVTVSATTGTGTPNGTVEFFEGTNSLGTVTVTSGTGTSVIYTLVGSGGTVKLTPPGSYQVKAVYTPDTTNFTTSTSPSNLTITTYN